MPISAASVVTGPAWPAIVWPLVLLAVFAPPAVRRYRRLT